MHTHTHLHNCIYTPCPQVVLNQVALAPVVLLTVFAWNLALSGAPGQLPEKIRRDLLPSLVNGGGQGHGCVW